MLGRPGDAGLICTSLSGAPLRRGNFRRRIWLPALKSAKLPGVHFHDLRHTGNNLAATAGANPPELMARMGHSSSRAALIYLHSTDKRQIAIADALGELAAKELQRGTSVRRSGTQRARRRTSGASTRATSSRKVSASYRVPCTRMTKSSA
jgi:hypothetical protein